LTFRTSKKHKSQESTKAAKNALKLASKFQRFLTTGVASKKDLKEVDERFISQLSQQSDKVLTLLDQLRELVSPNQRQEFLEPACEIWVKWVSSLDSKSNLGYSAVKFGDSSDVTQGVLLESVVDSETNLFQMLYALKLTLSTAVRNPDSLDGKACLEILEGAREIIDSFQSRQRMLGKIVNLKH